MRRKRILSVLAAVVAAGVLAGGVVLTNQAAPQNGLPEDSKQAADVLPVTQVVLFNSGVGYFQREGEVAGDSNVEMAFATNDINDLLKSLILEDTGGGKVNVVSYDSHDPLDKILRSFALDLTANPTFGEILNQARGEKVEVQIDAANNSPPTTVTGVIIGMEVRTATAGAKDALLAAPKEMLNLHTTSGMKSIPLNTVKQVRFLSQHLETEFNQALQVLAASHDLQKKRVTLGFKGNGKRHVKVGYVVERPIWKMTYRLRLEKDGKLYLQGWALVENTSDNDWKDVRMVLVSGRPISFKMNLYEPLYIPRPTVEPELFASLRPPVYDSSVTFDAKGNPVAGGPPAGVPPSGGFPGAPNGQMPPGQMPPGAGIQFAPVFPNQGGFGFQGGLQGGYNAGGGGFNFGGGYQGGQWGQMPFNSAGNKYQNNLGVQQQQELLANKGNRLTYEELQKRREQQKKSKDEAKQVGGKITGLNFKEGIESVAAAEEIGDYFQYRLDNKVSLARQRSAMLPVFKTNLDGAKVSIYNRSVHKRHPLLGLRFKNTSGKPLPQGPMTVFEEHGYAGDTRILDLQPNEERLLSYAMDLGTKVFVNYKTSPGPEMTVKLGANQLLVRYKNQKTTTYTITNRSTQDRLMIVEHPVTSDWKLIDPAKPAGKTNEVYRFEVKVDSEKTVKFDVVEEQERSDQVALQPTTGGMPFYASAPGLSVHVNYRTTPGTDMKLKIGGEQLTAAYQSLKTTSLLFENQLPRDRVLTFEYPIVKEWTLLSPTKAKEESKDLLRFELKLPKDKSAKFEMVEKQPRVDPVALTTAPNRPPFYAVVAGIEMKPEVKISPKELVGVQVVKGVLHVRHKTAETRTYYVRNAPDQERIFTIDQMIRPDWSLIDPQGKKHKGPGFYHYELKVGAGKTGVQESIAEKIDLQDKRLLKDESPAVLTEYLNSAAPSAAVKEALAKTIKLHEARKETERKIADTDKQLTGLDKDQARLRENLRIIPMNSDPYKRFLDKFVTQETRIEALQQELAQLQATLEKQTREFNQYVTTLTAK
jgi:hypothetical protein